MRIEYLAIALIVAGLTCLVTNLISKAGNTITRITAIAILCLGITMFIMGNSTPVSTKLEKASKQQFLVEKQVNLESEIPVLNKQSLIYRELPMTKLNPFNSK